MLFPGKAVRRPAVFIVHQGMYVATASATCSRAWLLCRACLSLVVDSLAEARLQSVGAPLPWPA